MGMITSAMPLPIWKVKCVDKEIEELKLKGELVNITPELEDVGWLS